MTKSNDNQVMVYDQMMIVRKCVDALKDLSENIPEEDRYASVLAIITERLDLEFNTLVPMALRAIPDNSYLVTAVNPHLPQ